MGALEKFLNNDPVATSFLIKAALVNNQFESIHPFLDGNGRVGRLLITLLLCSENILRDPLLYLSLYFKTNRQQYYALFQKVRTDEDWENWLRFFIDGVKETADSAVRTARSLAELIDDDCERIQTIGKAAGSVLRVHHALRQKPIATIAKIAEMTGISIPTITNSLEKLQSMKIVREVTGHKRGRLFCYEQYLNILNDGTEVS